MKRFLYLSIAVTFLLGNHFIPIFPLEYLASVILVNVVKFVLYAFIAWLIYALFGASLLKTIALLIVVVLIDSVLFKLLYLAIILPDLSYIYNDMDKYLEVLLGSSLFSIVFSIPSIVVGVVIANRFTLEKNKENT